MAKVEDNLLTLGLRGKVGNLIFRRRGNKTTVYILPGRKTALSEKEKKIRQHFSEAVAQARQAISNEPDRQRFEILAKKEGKESAYSAAISYYLKQNR